MKIRTREEFQDSLDKDSSWRKQELTNILFSLKNGRAGNEEYRIRSAIALTYAHWEGFVKTSSEYYLIYISFLGLKGKEVSPSLKKSFLQIKAMSHGEMKKFESFSSFWEFFESVFPDLSMIWDHKKIVHTRSNLRFEVFSEIANKLGIATADYETKGAKIDALVDLRNSIAHGEKPRVGLIEAIEYVEIIKSLIDHYKDDLINTITLETFKKSL